jgi:pyruvate/2-oxoglutarate dehydrogenase complex dihydrolipoamide acyltransferase (E2) component
MTEIAPERRHTVYFLEEIRSFAPVFLDTEVDMTAVTAHRAAARAAGGRYSVVSYVLLAGGRVLRTHPEANAAVSGGRRPKVASYPFAHGKVTLDKTINGRRVVLATVVPNLDTAELDDVQRHLERFRDGDPATMPEFAAVRALDALDWRQGRRRFRRAARSLTVRPMLTGTFAVTSLGHRAVDSFHSVGGTTITLGVGRVADRPVARGGAVTVAPVMRLSLAFDHRVIDGAEAADVLTEIKEAIERFGSPPPVGHAVSGSANGARGAS